MGDLVTFLAAVNYMGNSSMEVGIKVVTENVPSKENRHVNSCFFTMVAIDDERKPTTAPPHCDRSHRTSDAGTRPQLGDAYCARSLREAYWRHEAQSPVQQRSHRGMTEATTEPAPASALTSPRSKTDLFLSFTWLALQGFGGALVVVQRELVEKKRWMSRDEFVEEWAVAQIMPGPNVVNLAIAFGARHFGLPGAIAAVAGMLTAPLLVVLSLGLVYSQFADNARVAGALRGMGAVSAGLFIATGLKLISALSSNVLGRTACTALGALCFVGIAVLRLPLAYVLFGLGAVGYTIAWRRLKP